VGPDGTGYLTLTLPGLTLGGPEHDVLSRAVILHERADDFGQPTGNAGDRIACGVIAPGA
jgi:Cu-Zn family superoxide dismutase